MIGADTGRAASPSGSITTESNRLCMGNNTITNAYIKFDWTVTSDKRDKTDIVDLPHGLDFINQTRPVRFKWDIRDGQPGQGKQGTTNYGFIAQELLPNLGTEKEYNLLNHNTEVDEYNYSQENLIAPLVKAVQELSAKNDELQSRIEELEG